MRSPGGKLRAWLSENHRREKECWVAVRRGRPVDDGTFWYVDAVEEALCFGWIDSTVKKLPVGSDGAAAVSPPSGQCLVGAEQGAMPEAGAAGADDRCGACRIAGYDAGGIRRGRGYPAGVACRPGRLGAFLRIARTLQTGKDRHHPDKTEGTGTFPSQAGEVRRMYPCGDSLRRMERQRQAVESLRGNGGGPGRTPARPGIISGCAFVYSGDFP